MPSLIPDLGLDLDLSSIQAQAAAWWQAAPAYDPVVPDLNSTLAGIPLWTILPALLTVVVIAFGLSAMPWRAADRLPTVAEKRHGDLAVSLSAAGVLLTVVMAQGFIMAARTIVAVPAPTP